MTAPVSEKAAFEEIELPRGALRMYEDMVSIKFGDNVVYIHQTTDDFRDFEQKLSVLYGELSACVTAICDATSAAAAHEEFSRSSRTWLQADVTYGIPHLDTLMSSATVSWSVVCEPRKALTVDFRIADCSHTARDYDTYVIDADGSIEPPSFWSVAKFVHSLLCAVMTAQRRYRKPEPAEPDVPASKTVLAFPRPIS